MRRTAPYGRPTFRRLILALAGLLVAGAVTTAPAQATLALSSTPAQSWRVDGTVYASVVVGDTLVVGGTFTAAVSPTGTRVDRANLAAFSMSTGALLTGWRADTNGRVRALVSDGSSVWAGGAFRTVGGLTRAYVAKLSAGTGAVATGFNAKPNSGLRALALSSGRLYLGGTFKTVASQSRIGVAAVDAGTGALDSWAPQTNGSVYALAVNPGSGVVYVGGDYTTIGGAARTSMAAVDSAGWVTDTVFAQVVRPVLALTVSTDGSRVFGGLGALANAVFAWNTGTGLRDWRRTTDGDVQAVLYYDGMVYAGFHDGYQGDTRLKLLALYPNTGSPDTFRPTFDQFYGVFALAGSSAGLVAGGTFTSVSGVPAQGFARFASG